MLFEKCKNPVRILVIDLGAHHEDVHAHIQPEHDQRDRRQAAIAGKAMEIIDIDRYTKGKEIPGDRADKGTRKLFEVCDALSAPALSVWQCPIEQCKNKGKPTNTNETFQL